MPQSAPVSEWSIRRRAPEPLEEAVEKAVVDMMAWALRGYCDLEGVNVTLADVGSDLEVPAVVVRAIRLRESIPAGDVYELGVTIHSMTLMDQDMDEDSAQNQQTGEEFTDALWSAVVGIIEDPHLFDVLSASRNSVRWHGLVRQQGVTTSRQDRHAVRSITFNVHVSRLLL